MLRSDLITTYLTRLTARRTRTVLTGFGTALALAVTAMAASSPVATPGEEPGRGVVRDASGTWSAAAAPRVTRGSTASPDGPPGSEQASPPAPRLAVTEDGHFGGRQLALALAAAGRPTAGGVRPDDVVEAAADLGVTVSDPVTAAEAEAVAAAAWEAARHQFTLSAIGPGDAPDPSDIREAAQRFGVKVHKPLQPSDVMAVLAAGRKDVKRTLSKAGVKVDGPVAVRDIERAAKKLDVKYGKSLQPTEAKVVVWVARDKVKRRWEAKHRTPAFARAAGVRLYLPSHRVEYAGFHQAAYPGVITMEKAGKARTHVLPSRSRGTSRRSAIDIVQAPGEDVRAPVTGRVIEVTSYALYGKYGDIRMRIRPKDNRNAVVTVLHVQGAKVGVGDWVKAGRTVIAGGPRKFPFASQVDAFAGRNWGHVHVEIRWR